MSGDAGRQPPQRFALVEATRDLALSVATTDVDPAEMAAATASLAGWSERLGAGQRLPSAPAPTYREAVGAPRYDSGAHNPGLPAVPMTFAEGQASARLTLNELYEGPRDHVHGGVLSFLMDTLLASLVQHHGLLCVTASLTTNYRARTPLHRPLDLSAHLVEVGTRKVHAAGSIRVEDRVTLEATALFITVDDR